MKKKLAMIVFLVIALAALWVTPAFAAQGTITEVNPSGLQVANEASDGNADNRNEAADAPVFEQLTGATENTGTDGVVD